MLDDNVFDVIEIGAPAAEIANALPQVQPVRRIGPGVKNLERVDACTTIQRVPPVWRNRVLHSARHQQIVSITAIDEISTQGPMHPVIAPLRVDDIHVLKGLTVERQAIDKRAAQLQEDQLTLIRGARAIFAGSIQHGGANHGIFKLFIGEGFGCEVKILYPADNLDPFVEPVPTHICVREYELARLFVAAELVFHQLARKDQPVLPRAAFDGVIACTGYDDVVAGVCQHAVIALTRIKGLVPTGAVHRLGPVIANPQGDAVQQGKCGQLHRLKIFFKAVEHIQGDIGEIRDVEEVEVQLVQRRFEPVHNTQEIIKEVDVREQWLQRCSQRVKQLIDAQLIDEIINRWLHQRIKDRTHRIEQRLNRAQDRCDDVQDLAQPAKERVKLGQLAEDVIENRKVRNIEGFDEIVQIGLGGVVSRKNILRRVIEGRGRGHKIVRLVKERFKISLARTLSACIRVQLRNAVGGRDAVKGIDEFVNAGEQSVQSCVGLNDNRQNFPLKHRLCPHKFFQDRFQLLRLVSGVFDLRDAGLQDLQHILERL